MSKHVREMKFGERATEYLRSTWRTWAAAGIAAAVAAMVGPGMVANAATTLGYHSVTNSKIAPDAVSKSKIRANAVGASEVQEGSIDHSELANGGVTWADLNDVAKNRGIHADEPYGPDLKGQDSSSTKIPAGETAVVWTACAPGEAAVGGGYRVGDLSQESFGTGKSIAYPDLQVIASEAAYYKDGGLVNGATADPVNDNLSFRPNAWAVTVHNAGTTDSVARAQVVCTKVAG